MPEFKVGDRIICKDDVGSHPQLEIGREYEVASVYRRADSALDGYITLKGVPKSSIWWRPNRFQLVTPPLAEQIAEAEAKLAELKKAEAEARLAVVAPGAKFVGKISGSIYEIIAVDLESCWFRRTTVDGTTTRFVDLSKRFLTTNAYAIVVD